MYIDQGGLSHNAKFYSILIKSILINRRTSWNHSNHFPPFMYTDRDENRKHIILVETVKSMKGESEWGT